MPQRDQFLAALVGDPVELDYPAFADELLVTVPGVVAPAETDQVPSTGGTSAIMSSRSVPGLQQPQAASLGFPAVVHVDQDGDDLAGRVGVDEPIPGATPAACRDR